MPIRTDRGRSAAFRVLWAFPLKSRRHVLLTMAAAAAVFTVGAMVIPHRQPTVPAANVAAAQSSTSAPPLTTSTSQTTTSTAPTTSLTTTSAPATTTSSSSTSTAPAVPIDRTEPLLAARGFMAHWVRPPAGATTQQWMDGVLPYVMPEIVSDLATVDPANIPATRVTGDPVVTSSAVSVVEVNVATDAGIVHVVVVHQPDGRWLVRTWNLAGQ